MACSIEKWKPYTQKLEHYWMLDGVLHMIWQPFGPVQYVTRMMKKKKRTKVHHFRKFNSFYHLRKCQRDYR